MSEAAPIISLPESEPERKRSYVAGLPDGIGRPTPIERPTTAEEIASYINRTKQLTDEAYEELVHDIGWRVMLLVAREKAWTGNVKAMALYREIVRESRQIRRNSQPGATRNVSKFVQPVRESADPNR